MKVDTAFDARRTLDTAAVTFRNRGGPWRECLAARLILLDLGPLSYDDACFVREQIEREDVASRALAAAEALVAVVEEFYDLFRCLRRVFTLEEWASPSESALGAQEAAEC